MATRDGPARRPSRLVHHRGSRPLLASHRPLEGDGHRARNRAGGTGHAQDPRHQSHPGGMTPARADLVVLAKAPAPGRTKTRCTPPCTPHQAAALAEAALADTLAVVQAAPARRRILALDGAPGRWLPAGFTVVVQRGTGLDERLEAAMADIVSWDDPIPTVLIGMDTPQVTTAQLTEAATRLAGGADAVLGPAADGGFWGIGLARPAPGAFLGVPMSTAHTGAAQWQRLVEMGLGVERLDELHDVDTWADALDVAAVTAASRFAMTFAAISAQLGAGARRSA